MFSTKYYYQIDLNSSLKGWQAFGHDLKVRSNLPESNDPTSLHVWSAIWLSLKPLFVAAADTSLSFIAQLL